MTAKIDEEERESKKKAEEFAEMMRYRRAKRDGIHMYRITGNPPPLTDAYRKAYKQYIVFSALLLGSQVIGINVEQIPYLGILLTNPQNVSIVLAVVVIYSLFKIKVEWDQCDLERRDEKWVRRDYLLTHWVGSAALLIFFYQTVGQTEVLRSEQRTEFVWTLFWGVGVIVTSSAATTFIRQGKNYGWRKVLPISLGMFLLGLLIMFVIFYLHGISVNMYLCVAFVVVFEILYMFREKRKLKIEASINVAKPTIEFPPF